MMSTIEDRRQSEELTAMKRTEPEIKGLSKGDVVWEALYVTQEPTYSTWVLATQAWK